jgi:ribonuclease J
VTPPTHDLSYPPVLDPKGLRIVALGGLGEIGRNMAVIEFAGRLLIIDVGVLFPEENQPGVDLILPDFSYIRDRLDDIDAVVLTHAHEDHIGGLPYLLREKQGLRVIGTRLTLALVEAKLREHRVKADVQVVVEGERIQVGPFDLEFIAVNHSIPDAMAVAVRTPAGTLLHTGDFKMDQMPLDRRITDLPAFARLGDEGVDLLMVDSTNAEVPGFVPSERDIAPVLANVIENAPRRVIVASFASHIHRVQQVVDAAVQAERQIAFVGRSMVRNMAIARELGYLTVPEGVIVTLDDVDTLPDDDVVLITTGSQGEPMAALSRMAGRDHKITIGEGDTVILASSLIPGNEDSVNRVINGLTRQGATVVHQGNARVHVSGHAAAGELRYVYNIMRPRHVMPVHGEPRHLKANAAIAVSVGIDPKRVLIADDGYVIDLVNGEATITGAVPCGFVYVDGSSVGGVAEASLKDRRILGDEGFISVVVVVDTVDGKVLAGPEIHARGFAEDEAIFDKVLQELTDKLERALADGISDTHSLGQIVRRTVGSWVSSQHRRRPMIVPVIVET